MHLDSYIASITSTYHHRYYHTCVADRVTEAKTAGVGDKDNKSVDDVGESLTPTVLLGIGVRIAPVLGLGLVLVLGLGLGVGRAVIVALTVVAVVEVLNVGERV